MNSAGPANSPSLSLSLSFSRLLWWDQLSHSNRMTLFLLDHLHLHTHTHTLTHTDTSTYTLCISLRDLWLFHGLHASLPWFVHCILLNLYFISLHLRFFSWNHVFFLSIIIMRKPGVIEKFWFCFRRFHSNVSLFLYFTYTQSPTNSSGPLILSALLLLFCILLVVHPEDATSIAEFHIESGPSHQTAIQLSKLDRADEL